MGADAEIFVFDDERYRAEVVPAVTALVGGRALPPWLAEHLDTAPSDGDVAYGPGWTDLVADLRTRPVDLARCCTWLGSDLRFVGDQRVDRHDPAPTLCQSTGCREAPGCPLHHTGDRHSLDALTALVEAVVALRCLGGSQFLGRTITPGYYAALLTRQQVPGDDPLWRLLDALASRGAVLGHQFGGTDGIHGWLTGAETAALAARLAHLDLPTCEPTFAALAAQQEAYRSARAEQWQAVSLSFVRTVARIAADAGRGVLWGNDVCPEVWRARLSLAG